MLREGIRKEERSGGLEGVVGSMSCEWEAAAIIKGGGRKKIAGKT